MNTGSKVINLYKGDYDKIYETFMAHLPELQEVYESLIDEMSKKTFCGYWLGRTSAQPGKFVYSNESHHFVSGFIPERGATVIEAGAYDGGTATLFSDMGYKVYSFELDRNNYALASKVAAEKNFVLENFGLGSYKHEMTYLAWGLASRLDSRGSQRGQIITLDSYVRENNLPRVDLIRLDVEGAELDTLKGAAATIARFKPILSLSAYRKLEDFWTLMNFVKSIRPDYEFAMRHLYDTPEDIPKDFPEQRIQRLVSLGLEPVEKSYVECLLFAR